MNKKINGNTSGIRNVVLEELKGFYDLRVPQGEFVSHELLCALAHFTGLISREISVYIARDGHIVDVSVGDASTVSMPEMRLTRNENRLCGVRCVHTHPNGDPRPSGVDLGTLRTALLDSMVSVSVKEGAPGHVYAAFVGERAENGQHTAHIYGPMRPDRLPHILLLSEIRTADDRLKSTTTATGKNEDERAVLVGMDENSLDELESLAETAGAAVVAKFPIKRRAVDAATYIGSGKLEELSLDIKRMSCTLVIFDDELTAVQLRNIEETAGARVIDRTSLILDIFAARATSREGRLQVELAQQRYRLPRLLGMGTALSRLGGGIGTRGPGERKLEVDRRRIRRRIFELEQEFHELEEQRRLRRARRDKAGTPLVALVGYTNAGKSTLTNALSGSSEFVSNILFATLDSVVRKVTLPTGMDILISDTVGFINKLPHELVKAFRSTLDEVVNADIILHVADASQPQCEERISTVEDTLDAIGAGNIPRILVLNKSDAETGFSYMPPASVAAVRISALSGDGLDNLLKRIADELSASQTMVTISVPYRKFEVAAYIRENGVVLEQTHDEEGTRIKALLDDAILNKIKKMLDE